MEDSDSWWREKVRLVDFSSQVSGCPATNVLDSRPDKLWLTEPGLPQWICLALDEVENAERDLVIKTVGFEVMHPYGTNPKVVALHVSGDGSRFRLWDTLTVSDMARGKCLFNVSPIAVAIYPFISLEIKETFGGESTYLNGISLYKDEADYSHSPSRPTGLPSKFTSLDTPAAVATSITQVESNDTSMGSDASENAALAERLDTALGFADRGTPDSYDERGVSQWEGGSSSPQPTAKEYTVLVNKLEARLDGLEMAVQQGHEEKATKRAPPSSASPYSQDQAGRDKAEAVRRDRELQRELERERGLERQLEQEREREREMQQQKELERELRSELDREKEREREREREAHLEEERLIAERRQQELVGDKKALVSIVMALSEKVNALQKQELLKERELKQSRQQEEELEQEKERVKMREEEREQELRMEAGQVQQIIREVGAMTADALDRVELRHAAFVEAFAAAAGSRVIPVEHVQPPVAPDIAGLRERCGLGPYLSQTLESPTKDGFSTFSRRRKAGRGTLKRAHIWLHDSKGRVEEDAAEVELRRLGRLLKQAHHKRRLKEEQLRKLQSYNALSVREKEVQLWGEGPKGVPSTYLPGKTRPGPRARSKDASSKAAWR